MVDRGQKEFSVRGGDGPGEIGDLEAKFIIPGGGSFGRDKTVSVDEATAARVTYVRDGQRVVDQSLSVPEAVALVEKAVGDGQAADQRRAAAQARQQAELDEARRKVANVACTVCGYQHFDEQTSREDSQMGYTTFRMRLLICKRCGFVMQFSLGRSLFVPG
jgi:uncharacterized protein